MIDLIRPSLIIRVRIFPTHLSSPMYTPTERAVDGSEWVRPRPEAADWLVALEAKPGRPVWPAAVSGR